MSTIRRVHIQVIPRRRMASIWLYISSVIAISVATIASPIELIDRAKRQVTPISSSTNDASLNDSATFLQHITQAIEELEKPGGTGTDDISDEIGTVEFLDQVTMNGTLGTLGTLDQEWTELITRNTRSTRSRTRGRTSAGRTTTRSGSHGTTRQTTGGAPPRTPPRSSGGSSGRVSRRGGGSSTSTTGNNCERHDCNDAPMLADTVRTFLRDLYGIVSDILGDEFSRPRQVSDANLIVLLNFVDTHGGDLGKRFVLRIGRAHRTKMDQWEQCCQLFVVGRRRKRSIPPDQEQIDLTELILALMVYDIPR